MTNGKMPSWKEWSGLKEDQRQYSLYKILSSISEQSSERKITCGKRFRKLEKRKRWNSAESLAGGIIGGILAIIGGWAFWKGGGG